MRIFVLAPIVVGVLSQVFEAPNFYITEALLGIGVNVSAIPELVPFDKRSLLSGCSAAVSSHYRRHKLTHKLIML